MCWESPWPHCCGGFRHGVPAAVRVAPEGVPPRVPGSWWLAGSGPDGRRRGRAWSPAARLWRRATGRGGARAVFRRDRVGVRGLRASSSGQPPREPRAKARVETETPPQPVRTASCRCEAQALSQHGRGGDRTCLSKVAGTVLRQNETELRPVLRQAGKVLRQASATTTSCSVRFSMPARVFVDPSHRLFIMGADVDSGQSTKVYNDTTQ